MNSPQGFSEFAIRQMGTNAVPVLIQMPTREESSLESNFFGLAENNPWSSSNISELERRREA
jgi:hypothetical protein